MIDLKKKPVSPPPGRDKLLILSHFHKHNDDGPDQRFYLVPPHLERELRAAACDDAKKLLIARSVGIEFDPDNDERLTVEFEEPPTLFPIVGVHARQKSFRVVSVSTNTRPSKRFP